MKETLTFRIQELTDAIGRTQSVIQQQMANLNVLIGRKEECLHQLQLLEDKIQEPAKEVLSDQA